ncbi:MAG TPA: hypothetical protein VH120_18715 [Gemmataceae bacterium]|jgi:hypothetical protein|nr:hypothetical protein [Gemmataceae bacterium]
MAKPHNLHPVTFKHPYAAFLRGGFAGITAQTQNDLGQETSLFNPFTDDLDLVSFFTINPALASTPNLLLVGAWQVIELKTNTVVYQFSAQATPPQGTSFRWALGPGTPHGMGLQWGQGTDLFALRTTVEAFQSDPSAGWQALDAFAVSELFWFRLKLIYTL